jgi:hypothetical protein
MYRAKQKGGSTFQLHTSDAKPQSPLVS